MHFEAACGTAVSKHPVSRIMEKGVGELAEWSARPPDPIYPVLLVDTLFTNAGADAGAAVYRATCPQ